MGDEDVVIYRLGSWPVRKKSANGVPAPHTSIERRCVRCQASFLGLAAGKTGEVGLWDDWEWFCSVECFERPKPGPLVGGSLY